MEVLNIKTASLLELFINEIFRTTKPSQANKIDGIVNATQNICICRRVQYLNSHHIA